MRGKSKILKAARKAYEAGLYDTLDEDGNYPVAVDTITAGLKEELKTVYKSYPACYFLLIGLAAAYTRKKV